MCFWLLMSLLLIMLIWILLSLLLRLFRMKNEFLFLFFLRMLFFIFLSILSFLLSLYIFIIWLILVFLLVILLMIFLLFCLLSLIVFRSVLISFGVLWLLRRILDLSWVRVLRSVIFLRFRDFGVRLWVRFVIIFWLWCLSLSICGCIGGM